MGLMSGLIDALDQMLAPAGAFDSCSSICCENPPAMPIQDSMPSVEFHNAFGTAADYQLPAESGNLFTSNDWSSLDM
jgi:hypothetical protein